MWRLVGGCEEGGYNPLSDLPMLVSGALETEN